MDMQGTQLIQAPVDVTWKALNDPEVLKACIMGCESITATAENQYDVAMTVKVGPVSAKFKGKLFLDNVQPPNSYSLRFEGQGGAAGFGKGNANVQLVPEGDASRLTYDVKAQVGGKLAQIGSRLIDAAARKMSDDFFGAFNRKVSEMAAAAAATQVVAGADASLVQAPAVSSSTSMPGGPAPEAAQVVTAPTPVPPAPVSPMSPASVPAATPVPPAPVASGGSWKWVVGVAVAALVLYLIWGSTR